MQLEHAYKLNQIIQNGLASFENQNVASRSSEELINLLRKKQQQLVCMDRESGPLVAEAKKVAGQVRSFYYFFLCIFFVTDKKYKVLNIVVVKLCIQQIEFISIILIIIFKYT